MIAPLLEILSKEKVLILGFGREGKSTYRYIRDYFPEKKLRIADFDMDILSKNAFLTEDKCVEVLAGEKYLEALEDSDFIIKSPGVNLRHLDIPIPWDKMHTQTSLFLKAFHKQTIGITGTKGKSTTSSLIYHLLNESGEKAVLLGNIGIPPFDRIHEITEESWIVFEMSAHQLEHIHHSPHIAVVLNLFQEHLDYFGSLESYWKAKLMIAKYQNEDDLFIYNGDDALLQSYIEKSFLGKPLFFSNSNSTSSGSCIQESDLCFNRNGEVIWRLPIDTGWNLKGAHNFYNIQAAILAVRGLGLSNEAIVSSLKTFKGLEHRLEWVGNFDGITFYNDSIATIPEAVIQALETLKDVDTLILGGFDRGIDYAILVDYLKKVSIPNLIFTGKAGERIQGMLLKKGTASHVFASESFEEIVRIAKKHTAKGRICLLSPAAASYDAFKNFEERGNYYKLLINKLFGE